VSINSEEFLNFGSRQCDGASQYSGISSGHLAQNNDPSNSTHPAIPGGRARNRNIGYGHSSFCHENNNTHLHYIENKYKCMRSISDSDILQASVCARARMSVCVLITF